MAPAEKDITESPKPLLEPLTIGKMQLAHRCVMAPLTRCRALNSIPQPNAAKYYAQRATKGGMIISEATVMCPQGYGCEHLPQGRCCWLT